jgi:hypothetical protein
LFVRALSSAYKRVPRVYDPDYALSRDSDVYEKLLKDSVIAHAVAQRKHMVAGSRWQCEPYNKQPENKLAAQVMEEILGCIENFDAARFNLAEAIFRGSTYAFIEGSRQVQGFYDRIPRMWWVPNRIRDLTKYRIRQVSTLVDGRDGKTLQVHFELWNLASERWERIKPENERAMVQHLYDDTEETLGYGRGLVSKIYHYWRAKEIVLTENLNAIERFAQGLIVAKIDGLREGSSTNASLVNSAIDALEKHKARHILAVGKEDDVQMLSGSGEGHQLFESMRKYLDEAIRVLVLGASLPSSATEGGSYALAEIQENSTQALIGYDRKIMAQTLNKTLVNLVWQSNRAALEQIGLGGATPPRLHIIDEKISDPKKEAEITEILLRSGMDLKADETYELVGRTAPAPGDDVIEGQKPVQQMPGLPGAGNPFDAFREESKEKQDAAFDRGMAAASAMYAAKPSIPTQPPITVNVAPPAVTINNPAPEKPEPARDKEIHAVYGMERQLVNALRKKRLGVK